MNNNFSFDFGNISEPNSRPTPPMYPPMKKQIYTSICYLCGKHCLENQEYLGLKLTETSELMVHKECGIYLKY